MGWILNVCAHQDGINETQSRTIWHNFQQFFSITNTLCLRIDQHILWTIVLNKTIHFFFLCYIVSMHQFPSHCLSSLSFYVCLCLCKFFWDKKNSERRNVTASGCSDFSRGLPIQQNFNYLTFDFVVKHLVKSTHFVYYICLRWFSILFQFWVTFVYLSIAIDIFIVRARFCHNFWLNMKENANNWKLNFSLPKDMEFN